VRRLMSFAIVAVALLQLLTSCSGGTARGPVFVPSQLDRSPRLAHVVPFYDYGGGTSDALGSGGFGGLTIDANGTIYGPATYGGKKSCSGIGSSFKIPGCGLVYALNPDSTGMTYSETVLHVFKGCKDGNSPTTALLQVGKNFYGTTELGGGCPYSGGCGTVFEITPAGKETIVYRFNNLVGGAQPRGDLVADSHGNLFGTTALGGDGTGSGSFGCGYYGCGTVYELVRTGSSYKYRLVYAFQGTTDGSLPGALLLQNGAIFGTAFGGNNGPACYGSAACGTAFELVPLRGGKYHFVLLHTFAGGSDGSAPNRLVAGLNGILYGNTALGGGGDCGKQTPNGCGIIYSLSPAKHGSYVYSIIHRFGAFSDGQFAANVTYYNGTIYGITVAGGINSSSCLSPDGAQGKPPHRAGCGTIYSLRPNGKDFQVLYRFQGKTGGYWPLAALVVSNGSLYGATLLGGKFGAGTAYKVTP
jgi:uncharacterized repeat protein (TIGR03803 family)